MGFDLGIYSEKDKVIFLLSDGSKWQTQHSWNVHLGTFCIDYIFLSY